MRVQQCVRFARYARSLSIILIIQMHPIDVRVDLKYDVLCLRLFFIIIIRECGSTLNIEMYTQLQPQIQTFPDNFPTNPTSGGSVKTYLNRASNLKSTITFLTSFSSL